MRTFQKSTFGVFYHLSGNEIYLHLLAYFYKYKDDIHIAHRKTYEFFKGKTTGHIRSKIQSMVKFELIENVTSAFNEQNLGYKITPKGIKFFEIYRTIEAHVA